MSGVADKESRSNLFELVKRRIITMKFQDLSEQQILELFESAPLKDFDLIYKFYKTYINVVKVLCEALSGYGYQKDVYELYNAFYAPQKLSYASFSRILGEMEESGLISSKNANKKIVFMKQKAYALLGKNQTTIHSSRLNNRAMKKSEQLTKLHLLTQKTCGDLYRPENMKRSKHNSSIYHTMVGRQHMYFFFCLKERQKSEDLKVEALNFLSSHVEFSNSKELLVDFYFVVDEDAQRFETAFKKLKEASTLQYYQSLDTLRIKKIKL